MRLRKRMMKTSNSKHQTIKETLLYLMVDKHEKQGYFPFKFDELKEIDVEVYDMASQLNDMVVEKALYEEQNNETYDLSEEYYELKEKLMNKLDDMLN